MSDSGDLSEAVNAPDDDALRATLLAETSTVPWHELQRLFAAGAVMFVDAALDLLDVAIEVARDDASAVRKRIDAGQFGPVSDAQARQWYAQDVHLWACVVRPWVLVQDRSGAAGSSRSMMS